jgi:hypothetical protein
MTLPKWLQKHPKVEVRFIFEDKLLKIDMLDHNVGENEFYKQITKCVDAFTMGLSRFDMFHTVLEDMYKELQHA